MKIKKILIVLCLILLLNIVFAAENKVFILDLNYNHGDITVNDIMSKPGYAPDRKIEPAMGYRLDVISRENKILDSIVFEVPNKIYTDVINEAGEIEGGIVILDEFDFALIVPYHKDAEQIKLYDGKDIEVVSASVVPSLSERSTLKWVVGWIIIAIVLFFFFYGKNIRRKV